MKIPLVLLTAFLLFSSTEGFAQKVNFSGKDVPLKKVFDVIKAQTGYVFFYDVALLNQAAPVTVELKDATVEAALTQIFKDQPLTWVAENKTITIVRKTEPSKVAAVAPAANPAGDMVVVKGRVTEENGDPLQGASVIIKGTSKGVNTDLNGQFEIGVPTNSSMTLVVSFVGMEEKEINVAGKTTVQVSLGKLDSRQMEVVVVGYGTQKKATVTGAVAQIGTKELQAAPASNTSQLLVGRMPGLISKTASSLPGSDAATLQIRGYGAALVIVDGLPTPFNRIDPNDIESISILKDASAAIYGARAGNGVILVTTKRGKAGTPQISYTGTYTYQMPSAFQKTVNAGDYAELRREASLNYGLSPGEFTEEVVQKFKEGTEPNYRSYSWRDALFRTGAPMMQHSVTTSGGTQGIRYFASFGATDQQSVFTSDDIYYKRYNARLNVDATIAKNLSLRFDMQYRWQQNQQVSSVNDIMVDFSTAQPRYAPHLPDDSKNAYSGFQGRNPVLRTQADRLGYNRTSSNFFNGQVGLNYKVPFVEGLRLGADLLLSQSADYYKTFGLPAEVYNYDWETEVYTLMGNQGNFISLRERMERFYQIYPMLKVNYDRSFGAHKISAFGLAEQIQNGGNSVMAYRRDLLSPEIQQLYSGAVDFQDNNGTQSQDARVAYVGKLNYDYDGKYLAEFIFRADASANFPENSRWGYFPGVSVGWVFSREKFMDRASSWLTNGKLRLSYGQSGNDNTSQFSYLTGYEINSNYIIGNTNYRTITTTGLANPNITWEQITNYNAGIDLTFWRGKLAFEGNVFYRIRDGILATPQSTIPSTFGATLPPVNLNKQSNRGFEFMLTYRPKIGAVNLTFVPTFTISKNRWEYFDEEEYTDPDQKRISQRTGRSSNLEFGYISNGIFMTQEEINKLGYNQDQNGNTTLKPGDIRYVDLNKDGVIDFRDQDVIGKGSLPEVVYSMVMGATWKGFSIEMLWQGATGFNFLVTGAAASMFSNESIPYDYHYTYRWQPDPNNPTGNINPNAQLPAASFGLNQNNIKRSDFWMKDPTFIRLRNLNLSYDFTGGWTKRIGFKNFQVFASATNLITFSKLGIYKNTFDPDANVSGEGRNYPIHKNIAGGIRLTL
jgi:TonB-linked SusC/RagA family outer membrane protein